MKKETIKDFNYIIGVFLFLGGSIYAFFELTNGLLFTIIGHQLMITNNSEGDEE